MLFVFRGRWITSSTKRAPSQTTSTGLQVGFGTCISFALCQTCIPGKVRSNAIKQAYVRFSYLPLARRMQDNLREAPTCWPTQPGIAPSTWNDVANELFGDSTMGWGSHSRTAADLQGRPSSFVARVQRLEGVPSQCQSPVAESHPCSPA